MSLFGDSWGDEYDEEVDEFASVDPFDGISKRDQDLFFKVLDLLPPDQLQPAMEYFLSRPGKIRAVIHYVRAKAKDMVKNHDTAALEHMFEEEHINLDDGQEQAQTTDESDAYASGLTEEDNWDDIQNM